MRLYVFAHTPPPVHGQSVMVATLLESLRGDPEFEVVHIDARLSTDAANIGRWRPAKILRLLGACLSALGRRWRRGPGILYYVPAPGKRSALYRDFAVMLLCRPCFSGLVLHWHGVGLGEWLARHASAPERWIARRLLGGADLAIVLSPELAGDAAPFQPKRTAFVSNCAVDPDPSPRSAPGAAPCRVLYLGLCTRAKGLFDAVEAVALANALGSGTRRFQLTVAGGFAHANEESEFRTRIATLGADVVRYAGFVTGDRKRQLFASSDVFCFPTQHPHEGQPVTLIEALACDLPIVTTRWRAIPGMLPAGHTWLVEPAHPPQIAAALVAACDAGPANGTLRRHYLAHFTPERHAAAMKVELMRAVAGGK